VADHVHLSLWIRNPSALALPHYLERVLSVFPFSRLQAGAALRVLAVSPGEPPLMERLYDEADPAALVDDAKAFSNPDVAFEVDCFWELWSGGPEWSLRPSAVTLAVRGPGFESDNGEQIWIDAGAETLYLPQASNPPSLRPVQSNIRSLLRLAEDLGRVLPVERRALWQDSGENFAERLEESL